MSYETPFEGDVVPQEPALYHYQLGKDSWNNWMDASFENLSAIPTLTIDERFNGFNFDGFVFNCDVTLNGGMGSPTFVGAVFHGGLTIKSVRSTRCLI
jgi:hypothetical protein